MEWQCDRCAGAAHDTSVGLNVEGIVELPNRALSESDALERVSDDGSRNFYAPTLLPDGDDGAAKALP